MLSKEIIKQYNQTGNKVDFLLNYSIRSDESWKVLSSICKQIHLNVGTSFSGIGAPEYALKRLGINSNILFAGDIDEFCKTSYFNNYKISEKQWHSDVKKFNADIFKDKVDLFIGGSPCQSFSIGGKRKGFAESRGTLFYEYARLVNECQPKVFIYENVTGLMNHDHGNTWEVVRNTFDELGYVWTYWVLNSKDFGIPQNRKRVFVVGFRKDLEVFFTKLEKQKESALTYEVEDVLEDNVPNKYYLPKKGFERVIDPKQLRHVKVNGKIARTQIANQQYNWYGDMRFESDVPQRIESDERIYKNFYQGIRGVARCLTPRECLRLMGFDDNFCISVNDQQMYKQCGNSIVVNVLMEVMKSIIKTGIYNVEQK